VHYGNFSMLYDLPGTKAVPGYACNLP